jgi:hypothetical protein
VVPRIVAPINANKSADRGFLFLAKRLQKRNKKGGELYGNKEYKKEGYSKSFPYDFSGYGPRVRQ